VILGGLRLKEELAAKISPNGVRSIWLREKMNTMALRLEKAKLIPQPL